MTGLRSELSFIAERNRINDRKQQQLEQIISQMEDQASSYSTQLIQLQEKLADKDMIANSLEGKLNEKNVRLVEVRAELDSAFEKNKELQREVRWTVVVNETMGSSRTMVGCRKGEQRYPPVIEILSRQTF